MFCIEGAVRISVLMRAVYLVDLTSTTSAMVNDMNKQTFIEQKAQNLPNFDALPLIDGLPKGCSWDLWDCDGVKDEFGTLNLLTSSVVSSAAAEIKDGISVSLKSVNRIQSLERMMLTPCMQLESK